MNGKLIGTLLDPTGQKGIRIELIDGGLGVKVKRIVNGEEESYERYENLVEVYDSSQGNYVSGFIIHDATGNPTDESYKLKDFTMSGNMGTNRTETIQWWNI